MDLVLKIMLPYTLNLVDLVFTLYAIRNGAWELNPLMRDVPTMVFYKIVVVGALCWWLGKRDGKIARDGLRICTAVYAAVDLYHIFNLWRFDMNPWHLVWIVPLSVMSGFVLLALISGNSTPRNCRECDYARGCRSWYGGTGCKYKEEIGK